jgi:hypothetical protein
VALELYLAQDKIIVQRVAFAVEIALEILDQGFLHPEHCVLIQMRRTLGEEVGCQRVVTLR